jgi:hypothetical protein
MTASEVAKLLAIASEAYPGRFSARESTVALWQGLLGDIAAPEAANALLEHIAESAMPPTISDIRRRVADRRVSAPAPGDAWGEVRRKIDSVGRYRSPEWSHPAIASAVEAIGWQVLCDTPVDQAGTVRAQFERYFTAAVHGAAKRANSEALCNHVSRSGQVSAGSAVAALLGRNHGEKA